MKKAKGRILNRGVRRVIKIVSISALGSLVAICSPQAVCHVSASDTVKFSSYLMIEDDGEFATDENGAHIQILDEKGNLLAANEDVKDFLAEHSGENGGSNLAAREKAFYLIGDKLYLDASGDTELTNLSEVMPAMFKYGAIDSGYALESEDGTINISPLCVDGDAVYVARITGTIDELPAFTISENGDIGYLERGSVSDGSNRVSFVYDSNYFYDENLKQLVSMEELVPEEGDEDAPMFAGFYIKNDDGRLQFIDIDGAIVLSAEEYKEVAKDSATEAEYCYVLTLSAEDADSLELYSDLENGQLYEDYQRSEAFDNVGEEMMEQLSYDEESNASRGHFAGFYLPGEEEGSVIRFIDSEGSLIDGTIDGLDGNEESSARFYHILTADGSDEGTDFYYSEGKTYSDSELMNEISNLSEVFEKMPEDTEKKVHNDKKDMDGIEKRYFLGYYFASDFSIDEDDDEEENETEESVLLSKYDEEDFDPADVEIYKVKFADRNGKIVFDPEDAGAIDGDYRIFQNWYTVTIWNDGEVETSEDADESVSKDDSIGEEEFDNEELTGEEIPGEDEIAPDESEVEKPSDDAAAETKDSADQDEKSDDDKEVIEETAKPSDKDQGTGDDGGSDGEGGSDGGEADTDSADIIADLPKSEDDGE